MNFGTCLHFTVDHDGNHCLEHALMSSVIPFLAQDWSIKLRRRDCSYSRPKAWWYHTLILWSASPSGMHELISWYTCSHILSTMCQAKYLNRGNKHRFLYKAILRAATLCIHQQNFEWWQCANEPPAPPNSILLAGPTFGRENGASSSPRTYQLITSSHML